MAIFGQNGAFKTSKNFFNKNGKSFALIRKKKQMATFIRVHSSKSFAVFHNRKVALTDLKPAQVHVICLLSSQ
jgi:hypothetical protein